MSEAKRPRKVSPSGVVAGEQVKTVTIELQRRKEKVAIVGFAPTWNMAPFKDNSYEIWGCNEIWQLLPRLDLLFELHSRKQIEDKERDKVKKEHLSWMQNTKTPILMQQHFDDIPMSIPYPRDFIKKRFDTNYFTNTISWQIALAIHLGFKEIALYGINMANDEEFKSQRPSCEYFVGLARGLGIKIFIPDESDLLHNWLDYGFDDDNASIMCRRIKHFRDEHVGKKVGNETAAQNNIAAMHQSIGAIQAADYMLNNFVFPNTNMSEKPKEG
jgi:hypothetical protein